MKNADAQTVCVSACMNHAALSTSKQVDACLLPFEQVVCQSKRSKCETVRKLMQVWEQEFAWTEAEKPVKLAARALTVPGDHHLNKQPIFCFETMMHMLYWSCLVYDHQRVRPVLSYHLIMFLLALSLSHHSPAPPLTSYCLQKIMQYVFRQNPASEGCLVNPTYKCTIYKCNC